MSNGHRTSEPQQPAPIRGFVDEKHCGTPDVPYTPPQTPPAVHQPTYGSSCESPSPIFAPQPYLSRYAEQEASNPAATQDGGLERCHENSRPPSPPPLPSTQYVPLYATPAHADQDHYETSRTPSPLPPPSTQYVPPYATPAPPRAEGAPYNSYAAQEPYNPNTLAPQYGGLEAEMVRDGGRTPSPMPSEMEAMEEKMLFNWRKTFSPNRYNRPRLAIIGLAVAVYIAFTVEQDHIIKALQPAATHWVHE